MAQNTGSPGSSGTPAAHEEKMRRAMDVQQKYQSWLLTLPHVIGVGVGYATQGGATTPEVGLIVMVDHKTPEIDLSPADIIPRELDGVRVDVQELGIFTAGG